MYSELQQAPRDVTVAAPRNEDDNPPDEIKEMFKRARELINETWESDNPGRDGTDLGHELSCDLRSLSDYFTSHPQHVRLQLCGLIEYLHYADLCPFTYPGYSDEEDEDEDFLTTFCSNVVCESFIEFILSQPAEQQPQILREFIEVEERHIGDFFEFNFVEVIREYYAPETAKCVQLLAFLGQEEQRQRSGGNGPRPPSGVVLGQDYESSYVKQDVKLCREAFMRKGNHRN